MPRLRHYDNDGTARFVTMLCHRRYKLFQKPTVIEEFLCELEFWRSRKRIDIFSWVVMPEHVHLVLRPVMGTELGRALGILKLRSAKMMLPLLISESVDRYLTVTRNGKSRRVFWTRRVYDHNCRSPEAVLQKIEYCHKNPVRRGLVADVADWPWSSYLDHLGMGRSIVTLSDFKV